MEAWRTILERADLRGNEYAWKLDDFPVALAEAARHGFRCWGGQFQFRLPDCTCEMYWLNIEAPTHSTNENWKTYVARCEAWVRIDFDSLVRSTDFMKEAESFGPLRARAFFGDTSLLDSLVFVAYFENESGESI